MKTSKRKRSPKSEPIVALDSAPAAAVGAEPAAVEVIAAEPANEPVVAEAIVATSEPVVAQSSEPVVAEVSESVAADEVVASNETVVAEANVAASEAVAAESSEPVEATNVEPVIVLAANCSVKDAAALKSSLCAVANQTTSVTLDASAVERVDTATMQLLCAFVRDRSARNQSIVWRGQSQALHDAVRLLGVAALIGFDAVKGVAA
jgi:ABC-type transporter Mla MlaB component